MAENEMVDSIIDSTDVNLSNSEWQELGMLQAMGLQTVRYDLVTEHRNGKAQIYMWPKTMFFQHIVSRGKKLKLFPPNSCCHSN